MYIESGNKDRCYWLLKWAERIAATAENKVNLGDVKMGWGFWHQRFGTNSKNARRLNLDSAYLPRNAGL